jgi:hypothetical protein
MEVFIIVNFLNNYQYWPLRYNLELTHPNIAIQKNIHCTTTSRGWDRQRLVHGHRH